MKNITKKIYILIAALLIVFPVFLMPFFVNKNKADIQAMDYRFAVTFEDVLQAENKKIIFEDWFNDHLAFRKEVISSHAALNLALHVSTDSHRVVVGEDGWLFLGDYYNQKINKYRRAYTYDDASVARSMENIKVLDQKLSDQHIDFVCIMAPDKSSVYPEYMPNWATIGSKPKFFQVVDRLGGNDVMVDLTPALVAQKKTEPDYLYYKSDSHWTSLGAYYGYLALMNTLNKDKETPFKVVEQLSYDVIKEDSPRELLKALGFAGDYDDDNIKVNIKPNEAIKPVYLTEDTTWRGFQVFENNNAINPETLLVIGDSFALGMRQYYYNTFKKTYFLHYINVQNTFIFETESSREAIEEVVKNVQPDIVVFETIERDFYSAILALPETY